MTDQLQDLPSIAHALWVAHMLEQGWTPSDHYDAAHKLDDTLVAADALDPTDLASLKMALEAEEIPKRLVELVELVRTPPRVLRAKDLSVGLGVRIGKDRGAIDDWALLPSGQVDSVRVRWADGSFTSHDPLARELVLAPARPDSPGAG